MRVLLMSTAWCEFPPIGYGGIENVIYDILLGAKREKLDVEYSAFSVGDTARHPEVEALGIEVGYLFEKGLYADHIANPDTKGWIEAAHALAGWQFSENQGVDLIHDHTHTGFSTIAAIRRYRPPILLTLHGTLDRSFVRDYLQLLQLLKDVPGIYFNSISDAQRKGIPDLSFIATVHNGIDIEKFPYQEQKSDYLFVIGRITSDKGQHRAIEVARSSGKNLVIAGEPEGTREGEKYWREEVKTKIDVFVDQDRDPLRSTWLELRNGEAKVIYFGSANFEQKIELYKNASCLLMPIDWEEPFGLVMPEAMACGTPVVAFKRGAAPEIVQDQKTGFLVQNLRGMTNAVKKIGKISPQDCRSRVRDYFSARVMARNYYKVYQEILTLEQRTRRKT